MSRFALPILLLFAACSVEGCVRTPTRDGLADVRINNVTKRIKCDIRNAIFNKAKQRAPNGTYPYLFLGNWAAKVHLTFVVDDMATINPGATVITPLHSVGSASQSFSLGLGVGLSTEAIRTEDVEFLMSFSDIQNEFKNKEITSHIYDDCKFDDGFLLESDLGLRALVDSALEPVAAGTLYRGHNVGPGAAAAATPNSELTNLTSQLQKLKDATPTAFNINSASSVSSLITDQKQKLLADKILSLNHFFPDTVLSEADKNTKQQQLSQPGASIDNRVNDARHLLYNADEAKTIEDRTQSIINNIVKPLYTIASASLESKCVVDVTKFQNDAISWSANVSLHVVDVDNTTNLAASDEALKATTDAENKVISFARQMATKITCCGPKQKDPPPTYDPLDLISETVNFYITSSGSLTPTWKLVQATAPLASTFLSGSRKDTNTLILSMGRPVVTPDGTVAASAAMNNQILSSIVGQAVNASINRAP